jgi:hypothetical protein
MNLCATRYANAYTPAGADVTTTVATGPIVVHLLLIGSDNLSSEQIVTVYEGDGTTELFRSNVYTLGTTSNPFEGPVIFDKGLTITAEAGVVWSVAYSDVGS